MVGPVLGGFTIALWLPAAYLLSAAGTAVFMIVLLTLAVPNAERSRPGNMIRQVGEGVAFVWRQKLLLGAISLDLFAVLLGGGGVSAAGVCPHHHRSAGHRPVAGAGPGLAAGGAGCRGPWSWPCCWRTCRRSARPAT